MGCEKKMLTVEEYKNKFYQIYFLIKNIERDISLGDSGYYDRDNIINEIKKIIDIRYVSGLPDKEKKKLMEGYQMVDLNFCKIIEYDNYNDRININCDGLDKQKISDGYHTFEELYFHRMILFSIICKQNKDISWKSKLHNDGTMFENYFIVGINTKEGQFTYHYHMQYWDYFNVGEILTAPEWDGHKSDDITRLLSLIK